MDSNKNELNLEAITLEDCRDLHTLKGISTLINDGKIIGFMEE